VLSACSYSASEQFLKKANGYGFQEITLPTEQFALKAYRNNVPTQANKQKLHVYLAGDGIPFFRNRYTNPDPTPKQALILDLMALDPSPSVIIGRPCYHLTNQQRHDSAECNKSQWWTTHRYSKEIVNTLTQAINEYSTDTEGLVIIGFSGGATLATLLAPKLKKLDTLIGINPNLDTDAWVVHHQYTPLYGSLNPREFINEIPPGLRVILLSGSKDQNIPAELWRKHYQHLSNVEIINYANFNHSACCWTSVWPSVLEKLAD